MDEDYYRILLEGRTVIDGLSVLRPEYLILFKAKAYMDLKDRHDSGEEVHSSEYKKHKKDVLRIISELSVQNLYGLPDAVFRDISAFISRLDDEPFDINLLINYGVTNEEAVERLRDLFMEQEQLSGLWKDHEEVSVDEMVRNMRRGRRFDS